MKKRGKDSREAKGILFLFLRYFTILVASINGLWIFYSILYPITIYLSGELFKIFFQTLIKDNQIVVNGVSIIINNACVAGAAYYLLFILSFSVSLNAKKRVKVILFSFISLLVLNILRIFMLGVLLIKDIQIFDITHKIFWYFLSSIFILLIWILTIKIFRIKEVPIYSDMKYLFSLGRFVKLNKRI